ncbi:uncharacterized protein LOC130996270 [Salvia miltiorrhiza]|uniref:uncharacterized protein LOC130996270 n=1 Tax=Salvia miltiorrhiza TaxID=226208 RepID=UPI0025ACDC23|nr:uncharacterized protein LOC130996270 [Salvia miltiorrhiza]XP_057777764.1 uncharacterized protein LOC130996270 [Salvia miltiorrhiza]
MASISSRNSTVASSKSKRGKICLNGVAQRRAKGIKHVVEFNKYGQPVGKVAAEMQSYIGLLTREHVKINIKTWKQVPDDVKEVIWESVTSSYEVPQAWKVGCMKSASVKWRNWKHALRKEYILPNEKDHVKLYEPPQGSGISEREWNQFVIYCISNDFKNLSDEQKERRQKNIYPHRLSRKGYAALAEEMKDELLGDENIDRAIMWKKARLKKDGSVENEDLKKVVEKIDERLREKEQGDSTKVDGFYVMRFMKEIVKACEDVDSISVASLFKKCEYSESEINEVREDWAGSIINEI